MPTGKLIPIGSVAISLGKVAAPAIVFFQLRVAGITNRWKLAVYPPAAEVVDLPNDEIVITDRFDESTLAALQSGKNVLFLAHKLTNTSAGVCRFDSQYWSGGWWGSRFSQLGVMCDPHHPALAAFPSDGHSDWFWFDPLDRAVSIDLTDVLPRGDRPIIQAVTDFHDNRLLGQLFELRVGHGRLMVCGYNLVDNLTSRHAARQLRHSILWSMSSDRFEPTCSLSAERVMDLLGKPLMQRLSAMAMADSEAEGFEATKAIDGNPRTSWHTPWSPGGRASRIISLST